MAAAPQAAGEFAAPEPPEDVDPAFNAPGPSGYDYTIWGAKKEFNGIKLFYRKETAGTPSVNYRLLVETPKGEVIYADMGRSFGHLDVGGTTELSLSLAFAGLSGGLEGATLRIIKQSGQRGFGMRRNVAEETQGEPASNTVSLEIPVSTARSALPPSIGGNTNSGGSVAPAAPPNPENEPPPFMPHQARGVWHTLREKYSKSQILVVFLEGMEKLDATGGIHERVEAYKAKHKDQQVHAITDQHEAVVLIAPATELTSTAEELGLGSVSRTDSFQNTAHVTLSKALFKLNDSGILEDENHPEYFATNLKQIEAIEADRVLDQHELEIAFKRLQDADPAKCQDSAVRDGIVRHLHKAFNDSEKHRDRDLRLATIECLVVWDGKNIGEDFASRLRELARDKFFAADDEGELLMASLGKLQYAGAAETLAKIIASTNRFGGLHSKYVDPASEALIEIGPGAESEVRELVRNDDPEICLTAIHILSQIGTKRSLDLLSQASNKSTNREVREAAKGAMREIRARGSESAE